MTVSIVSQQQRETAKQLLTEKEYEAWDLVNHKGMKVAMVSDFLDTSRGAIRDRLLRADQKIALHSRAEFAKKHPARVLTPKAEVSKSSAVALLIARDGSKCYLCHEETIPGHRHVEHIIPRIHGGTDEAHNLALACADCNALKGTKFVSLIAKSRRSMYHAD